MATCKGRGKKAVRRTEMESCLNTAVEKYGQNQMEECVRFSKRCLNIAERLNDTLYKMHSSRLLMLSHRVLKDNDTAILYGEKCIKAAHLIGEQEKRTEKHACFVVGKLLFGKDQYEKAAIVGERGLRRAKELRDDGYQAKIYLLLQDCYLHLEKYDDAIKVGQKCISACRTAKETFGECLSYLLQSKVYKCLKQDEDSINARLKAADVATEAGDTALQISVQLRIGKILFEQGNYLEAITYLKKALEADNKDSAQSTDTHMELSKCYLNQGNESDALSHCLKCLSLAKQHGQRHAEVDALVLMADIFESMNRYTQALLNINKAIAVTEAAESEIHDHHDNLYFQQGMIYKSLQRYKDAIKSFQKCLVVAKKKNSKVNEKKSYFYIGNSFEFMNDFEKAIEYYNKYMTISKKSGDEVDILEAYLALGVAHLGLDQYDRSYSYLTDGKEKATRAGNDFLLKQFNDHLNDFKDRIGIHPGVSQDTKMEVVASFGNMVLAKSNKCDETNDEKESYLNNQQDKEIRLYKTYAEYRKSGHLEKAIVLMRKYLRELDRHPHYHAREKVCCILEIAEMHAELHQFDKALQCCKEAQTIADKVDACQLKAMCHKKAGDVYFRTLQLPIAIDSFKKSLHFVEKMMKNTGTHDQEDEFKVALLDLYGQSYKGLEMAYIHNKQLEEALIVSENSRARSLKDLLQKYGMQENITTYEEDLKFKHVKEIASANSYAILLYSTNRCDNCSSFHTYRIERENVLLFSAEGSRKDVQINVEQLLDKALFSEMKVHQISAAGNRSPDDDSANTTQKNGNKLQERPSSSKKDSSEACLCKKSTISQRNSKQKDRESALTSLHRMLLDNCMCAIKHGEVVFSHGCPISQDEIVLVPDEFLYMVPFAALKDPLTGRYLVETKRIRIVPSIATLKLLSDRPKDLDSKGEALIIGNPSVGKVICNGQEREFSSLFHTKIEAIGISNLFSVTPLIEEHATKSAVLEKLRQGVSVVHVAAHGDADKATIALAPSAEVKAARIPEEEDYMLTMADIQKTQVKAQLVVLSCCHSGLGKIKAEGVIGMCRAFLIAGARAVVGSLWAIDDDATREFMIQFYLNLYEKKSASLSLQLAMQYMMKDDEYSEPKYWAPFFLMGDDVTVSF